MVFAGKDNELRLLLSGSKQMTPEFANEVPCQQVAVPVSVSAPAPAFSNMGLRISGNGITVETGCCMDEKLLSVILEALKC